MCYMLITIITTTTIVRFFSVFRLWFNMKTIYSLYLSTNYTFYRQIIKCRQHSRSHMQTSKYNFKTELSFNSQFTYQPCHHISLSFTQKALSKHTKEDYFVEKVFSRILSPAQTVYILPCIIENIQFPLFENETFDSFPVSLLLFKDNVIQINTTLN